MCVLFPVHGNATLADAVMPKRVLIEVFEKKQPQWVHKLNSYASPTPVLENQRLYLTLIKMIIVNVLKKTLHI